MAVARAPQSLSLASPFLGLALRPQIHPPQLHLLRGSGVACPPRWQSQTAPFRARSSEAAASRECCSSNPSADTFARSRALHPLSHVAIPSWQSPRAGPPHIRALPRRSGVRSGSAVRARRGLGFLAEMETIKEAAQGGAPPLAFDSPLEVVLYPDPRLRAPNKLITNFDDPRLPEFVDAMLDAMYRTDGVGLSAPQVGVNVRLMVYNPAGERGQGKEWVLINPRIVKSLKAQDVEREGCLSFPDIHGDVERPVGVKVDAQDVKGRKFSLSLKSWQARIFQHEYDHLQGTLYFERMTPEVLDTVRPQLLELEELYEKTTQQPRPETVATVKVA